MNKLLALTTIVLVLALGGCSDGEAGRSAEEVGSEKSVPETSRETEQVLDGDAEPVSEPWKGPTDGTWEYGDVGFGNTHESRLSDFRVTVLAPPNFGPLEADKVRVTGTFNVERFRDRGFDDEILDDVRFGFTPGEPIDIYNEDYGLNVDAECDRPIIEIGESTTCRVSFPAPPVEIENFNWWINGHSIAAWPSQTVDD